MRIAFRDIEIDSDRFEILRAGEPVRLEPQAFEVLAHLIEHRDRVVTRDELMEAIWGSIYVSDAALATRIKEARRALGDDGTSQWAIRTIHRRGYRFVVDTEEPSGDPTGANGRSAEPLADAIEEPIGEPTRGRFAELRPPIGREAEFERLVEAHHATRHRGTQVVFLTGEAGIGKSTLIAEFVRQMGATDDVLVGRGLCIEGHGASEAYLPFLDAMGQLASGPRGLAAVRALQQEAPTWLLHMPGLAEGATPLPDGVLTRERMLRELTSALDRLGSEHRVVISLEDLHWADPSTLDAIEMLSRRESDAHVLVLGTIRTGDTQSGGHAIHGLASELTTRGYATTIPLGPLDEPSLRRVIEGRVPDGLLAEVASAVANRSGGNPLFATSLIEQWGHEGEELTAVPEDIPESLRQLVFRQLDHLPDDHRQIIEASAIAGDTLTPSVTAAISGAAIDDAEQILDAAAKRGQFLRRRGAFEWPNGDVEDEYQFIHSLFRETVVSGLPLGRRARMHRAAGSVLLERLGSAASDHIEEIAAHFVAGGDADQAVPALLRVARRAHSRSAQREARSALERALALIPRIKDEAARVQLEVRVQTLLGAVLIALDGWAAPSIQATYERALELVRDTDDHGLIREILAGLATTHEFRGEYELSERIITEQMELTPPDTAQQPQSHELLACSLFHQGKLRNAMTEAQTGLQLAIELGARARRSAYGEHPTTACKMWLAHSLWFLGDVRRAEQYVIDSIEEAPDDLSRLHVHFHAGMMSQYAQDIRATRHHARRMFALARALGFEAHEIASGLLRAWAEASSGYAEALPLLQRAVDAYRASGMRMDLPWVLSVQADGLIAHGHLDDADAVLEDAFAVRDPARGYIYESEMWRLRGRIALLRGDEAAAIEHFERAVAAAQRHEARTTELRALTALLRAGGGNEGTRERLAMLADELAEIGLQTDLEAALSAVNGLERVAH